MTPLPAAPGVYIVQLALLQTCSLQIGRLGSFLFPAGEYTYTGSAFGPGGLRARLGRHLDGQPPHRFHWHIDYLRPQVQVSAACYWVHDSAAPLDFNLECAWSQALSRLPGASIPAPGFGASDCTAGCPAHLVALPPGSPQQALLDDDLFFLLEQVAGASLLSMRVGDTL